MAYTNAELAEMLAEAERAAATCTTPDLDEDQLRVLAELPPDKVERLRD